MIFSLIKLLFNIIRLVTKEWNFRRFRNKKPPLSRVWADVEEALQKEERYIETTDEDGLTLFCYAAADGDINAMKMLKAHGANTEVRDKNGLTALHHAAGKAPEGRGIVWLLNNTPLTIESRAHLHVTPFLAAAISGNVKAMQILAQHGANTKKTTKAGWTALHHAAAGDFEGHGIRWLLKEADLDIESRDADSLTPFLVAAIRGNVKAMQLLKKKGANTKVTTKPGWTALHYAANDAPQGRGIRWLLKEAHLPVDIQDHNQETPFFMAVLGGNIPAMKLLKKYGANLLAKNDMGEQAAGRVVLIRNPKKRAQTIAWLRAQGLKTPS